MNELLFEPPTTPGQWCEIQPCFEIGGVTFTQPLGSILVYFLALLWLAGGIYFWRIRDGQRSREWMVLAPALGALKGAVDRGAAHAEQLGQLAHGVLVGSM